MIQQLSASRSEVMLHIGKNVEEINETYLKPIETNWQASELLPLTSDKTFIADLKTIQDQAQNLSYDFLAVLVADTITEEALPTYETWLAGIQGIDQYENNGWMKWLRSWSAEENRHGDALNRYLYLCGRIDMRQFEASTQYLIADGFDNGAANDPYKNFVYTSFQELATFVSHNRVALIAKKYGEKKLFKMCNLIAGDEMRHHLAYSEFVNQIFKVDPSEMMLAFQYMMKQEITMPAVFLRESGEKIGSAFEAFSDSAQRIGVYTAADYVDILEKLNVKWDIANMNGLTAEAEKARDYLMKLPERMKKISERLIIPEQGQIFKWVEPALIR